MAAGAIATTSPELAHDEDIVREIARMEAESAAEVRQEAVLELGAAALRSSRLTTPEKNSLEFSTVKWVSQGACTAPDVDPELFYPLSTQRPKDIQQEKQAKAICAGCKVAAECLKYALDTQDNWGIWGGRNPDERQAMKSKKTSKPSSRR